MESMGVATGCGFKEIYRFPHTTYPYSSVSVLFCSSLIQILSKAAKVAIFCSHQIFLVHKCLEWNILRPLLRL